MVNKGSRGIKVSLEYRLYCNPLKPEHLPRPTKKKKKEGKNNPPAAGRSNVLVLCSAVLGVIERMVFYPSAFNINLE